MARGIIDRALRLGEGRKLKEHEAAVEAINRYEPEFELLDDAEIREHADELRERAREDDESLDELLPEAFALCPRGGQAGARPAPLRRPADRRHGPARRRDRRDEDRRGQDADRDQRRVPEHARRRRRPPGHRQRLPRPPRRAVDEADLRHARGLGRRDPVGDDPGAAAPDVRRRRHLRDQLRVRLRLPARQHGELARGVRAARARVRDRRRGRQHPDRRGADAADHLRPARAGRRHLLHVRPPRQADGRRGDEAEAEVAGRVARHLRGRARLRVRREAQDRRADRGRGGEGGEVPRRREPLRLRARDARQPPDPVAEGRVAVQARQRLRGDRRRGEDHRRVHRPHPRGPALVGRPAPGGRGEGGRADPRGEPDPRDDHAAELLPPLRQAQRDDRHRAHRGDRVHEDLRDAGGRDPDPPADGPRRPQRPDLQDQGRQVEGGRRRDRASATRAASRSSSARSRSRSPRCSPSELKRAGIEHVVLNAKPEYAAARGRDRRPGGAARRGHDRDQHGGPRRRHQARRRPRAARRRRAAQARRQARARELGVRARRAHRALQGADPGRGRQGPRGSAACSSAAPSATSRGGSTTSCAAAPAARATRASRASSSPPRTT